MFSSQRFYQLPSDTVKSVKRIVAAYTLPDNISFKLVLPKSIKLCGGKERTSNGNGTGPGTISMKLKVDGVNIL